MYKPTGIFNKKKSYSDYFPQLACFEINYMNRAMLTFQDLSCSFTLYIEYELYRPLHVNLSHITLKCTESMKSLVSPF